MSRIAIVCINYNTDKEACDFVEGIYKLTGSEQVETFVVDNSALTPEKSCFSELKKKHSLFHYLPCPENPGYFGAAQFFLKNQNRHLNDYDWVIISNSDITISDSHFIEKIMRYNEMEVGVLAPRILSLLSGHDTNPFMHSRPTKFRMHFYKWMFSNYLTSKAYHVLAVIKAKIKASSGTPLAEIVQPAHPEEIYAPHGAFMIFSRAYFQKGGDFSHPPFLYGEEVTVAENCRALGLKVVFEPNLEVVHRERASTGVMYSRKVLNWKKEASRYSAEKYFR